MLCAGLPTLHLVGPKVSSSPPNSRFVTYSEVRGGHIPKNEQEAKESTGIKGSQASFFRSLFPIAMHQNELRSSAGAWANCLSPSNTATTVSHATSCQFAIL